MPHRNDARLYSLAHTRMFIWSSQAHLSQSALDSAAADWQLHAEESCPPCHIGMGSAPGWQSWRMFWHVCPWFHATWRATQSIKSHADAASSCRSQIPTEAAGSLLLIKGMTVGLEPSFCDQQLDVAGTERLLRARDPSWELLLLLSAAWGVRQPWGCSKST